VPAALWRVCFPRWLQTSWQMLCELMMNKKKAVLVAVVVIAVLFIYYLYGGSSTPAGQPPLVRLNNSNLASFKEAFNGSASSVRVLLLVSPT
jgi:hypothetical protein